MVKKDLFDIPEAMYQIETCINYENFISSEVSDRYGSRIDEDIAFNILRDNYSKFNICEEVWNQKRDKPSIIIPNGKRTWYDFSLICDYEYTVPPIHYANVKSTTFSTPDNISSSLRPFVWALFGKKLHKGNRYEQYNDFLRMYNQHLETNFENANYKNYHFLVLDKKHKTDKNCFVTSFSNFTEDSLRKNEANLPQCDWLKNSNYVTNTVDKSKIYKLVGKRLWESIGEPLNKISCYPHIMNELNKQNDINPFKI